MGLKYVKTRNVEDPQFGTGGSAGIDFFMPQFDEMFIDRLFEKNDWLTINDFKPVVYNKSELINTKDICIIIPPHKDLCIPSGLHWLIPDKQVLLAINKSGIALNKKLIRGAELIDWDYQGEVHCHVINTSDSPKKLIPGQKVIQFIHINVLKDPIETITVDDLKLGPAPTPNGYTQEEINKKLLASLYPNKTERGDKGFSSTGLTNKKNEK